jgi:hypothetical protein
MAEFDPTSPQDATEAAYRQALLADDSGRQQRRERLMAALPPPRQTSAVPVSAHVAAWRWRIPVMSLAGGALVLSLVALVLQGRDAGHAPPSDPRLAKAAQPASATPATVVAQATPAVDEAKGAPAADNVARQVARAAPARPAKASGAGKPPAEVRVAAGKTAAEPAAPVVAAAASQPAAEALALASRPAEAPANAEAGGSAAAWRTRAAPSLVQSLAASDAADRVMPADARLLLAAIDRGDLAAARAALEAGASVHARDDKGRTALMRAARLGSREMVALLLAAGARKGEIDPQGLTAADHAVRQDHPELADMLR